ncbi:MULTISPECIES: globin-coupled sensor protein [Paenibacillus]|uniref:globin-coupled sensor protein n=1 Tax=Paenibacillus TaxID=44249 RepID=UPI0022B8721B|nr:globin-coupled sensor protein [Paenibacillus caseinilyticus]MCZ8519267.1 globin-coupled sensor protein [Paenibacillus caseinilyticus]
MSKCPFSTVAGWFGWKKDSKPAHHDLFLKQDQMSRLPVAFSLNDRELDAQLNMIQFTEQDLRVIKMVQPLMAGQIDWIVQQFYDAVLKVGKLEQIISDNSSVERLRQTLKVHLTELFSGQIDRSFIEKRIKIALIHQRIGLEPKWYIGAFQNLQNAFLKVIQTHVQDREESIVISGIVTKLLNFEQQLVLEAYEKENLRQRELEYERYRTDLRTISEELSQVTELSSHSVEGLIASSGDMKEALEQTVQQSKASQSLAGSGQERLNSLETKIHAIHDRADHMQETIGQLSELTGQIKEIVTIVQDIAEQTNLLSLNAAIEAARAGEHGRGFSIVADQVRKLSEDTKSTLTRIGDIVSQSDKYNTNVVRSISEVQQVVETSRKEAAEARRVFMGIMDSMQNNIDRTVHMESEMDTLEHVVREIGGAVGKVAASAETLRGRA